VPCSSTRKGVGGRHLGDAPAAALQRRHAARIEPVDAGLDLPVDLGDHGAGSEVGRGVAAEAGDHLDGGQQCVAETAAARRRAGFQPAPAQSGADLDLVGLRRAGAAGRACLGQQQVARVLRVQHQRRAALDAQHHDVLAGNGHQPRRGDTLAAACRHPHRVLQLPGQARRPGGGAAARRRPGARHDEGDGCGGGIGGHAQLLVAPGAARWPSIAPTGRAIKAYPPSGGVGDGGGLD
jgi:hypothetical protein